MATVGIPQQFNVQTSNQVILVSWAQTSGATSYIVNRGEDNITFPTQFTISGSPLATQYLDTNVTLGVQYFYTVQASNGSSTGIATTSQSAIPVPTGEMALSQIRLAAQQRADRVNSQFVTQSEWRNYINQAMFELYDLLVTTYEEYFLAPPIQFTANGNTYLYPLPNGSISYLNPNTNTTSVAPPFYKLKGVDLAVQSTNNGYVSIDKFNFADRNYFVYPNTASTIYGVFNMRYRVMGNNIEFIPTPSGNQSIRLWYIPRLQELLLDTDTTQMGISGWIEYVIVRAAKYALDKEESDTSILTQEIAFLKQRIEESASNRDAGSPDTISDVSSNRGFSGWGGRGSSGGFGLGMIPFLSSNDQANHNLANAVHFPQSILTYVILGISLAYFFSLYCSNFSGRVFLTLIRNLIAHCLTSLFDHVLNIFHLCSKPKMTRIYAIRIIAAMTNIKARLNRSFKNFIRNSSRQSPFMADRKPGFGSGHRHLRKVCAGRLCPQINLRSLREPRDTDRPWRAQGRSGGSSWRRAR